VKADQTVSESIAITSPIHWSAEEPYLYTLLISVAGEWVRVNVGFRQVEIRDGRSLFQTAAPSSSAAPIATTCTPSAATPSTTKTCSATSPR